MSALGELVQAAEEINADAIRLGCSPPICLSWQTDDSGRVLPRPIAVTDLRRMALYNAAVYREMEKS